VGSIPMLDGSGVKAMQDRFLHPILVHSRIEKNENTGSQMGHNKKIFFLVFNLHHPSFTKKTKCHPLVEKH